MLNVASIVQQNMYEYCKPVFVICFYHKAVISAQTTIGTMTNTNITIVWRMHHCYIT